MPEGYGEYEVDIAALIRSALWTSGPQNDGLPSVGDMLRDATEGRFDGAAYDANWAERAKASMW